jgi:AraC-like DNA-binding protein
VTPWLACSGFGGHGRCRRRSSSNRRRQESRRREPALSKYNFHVELSATWRRVGELMAETDLADRLSIADAAAQIGCSTRTVERLGKAKQLEQRLRRQEGTPPVAVYNPDDVARIAAERRRTPPPFVLLAGPTGNGHGAAVAITAPRTREPFQSADVDLIRSFLALAVQALQSPPSPPVAEKVAARPVLTLAEAVQASGWSRTYLLRQIHRGTLKAVKDGGWKIRRTDLEAL